jgi:hypothetical protein
MKKECSIRIQLLRVVDGEVATRRSETDCGTLWILELNRNARFLLPSRTQYALKRRVARIVIGAEKKASR